MKTFWVITAACCLVNVSRLYGEVRTWTNLSGQKLEAEMIGLDVAARSVQVRTPAGQQYSIPTANLSADDLAYAAARWRQMQADGVQPPVADRPGVNANVLPPRFANRCTEPARLGSIAKHGGTVDCEAAVTRSLQWLKTQQNEDGSWGRQAGTRAGYTGLVLQCYTGRCEGIDSTEFGAGILKAVDFLIKTAAANPAGILSGSPQSASSAYEHGLAATALGELYVLTRAGSAAPPGLADTFAKAVERIIDGQGKTGSWDYYPKNLIEGEPPSSREDLSVTNWQLQALLVAREAGLNVAGMEPCISRALKYLESKQTSDGGFGSKANDAHYNQWHMSGGALSGLQTLAAGKNSTQIARGIRFLRAHLTAEPMNWNGTCNLYTWVSNTTAFFHAGADDWKFYSGQLLPQLLSAQAPDGSFKAGRASWPASAAADPVYRQALCTLQLEVFYRHLK